MKQNEVQQQQHKLMVPMEKNVAGQVAYSFGQNLLIIRELDGVNIGQRTVVTEHLNIDGTEEVSGEGRGEIESEII